MLTKLLASKKMESESFKILNSYKTTPETSLLDKSPNEISALAVLKSTYSVCWENEKNEKRKKIRKYFIRK
jgi:hypothetical protein